ncbi:MAG TPA: c-type cytochrome [Myxococcota bacterium]|jgi:mono/diheme cytochrome c family protein|nr:c-type cytochrome [Myxococcota bacterium]
MRSWRHDPRSILMALCAAGLAAAPAAAAVATVTATAGCGGTPKFAAPMTLGGVAVPPEVLNQGEEAYMHYCRTCHGESGDGKGPSAPGYRPPPRDFTKATFKFASVRSGELPTDADFRRIIKGELHGTPMLGWEIPDGELDAIIQYIKTFATKDPANGKSIWETTVAGEPIPIGADPWGPDHRAEAVARGKAMYHGFAQCWACHPAYSTKAEMFAATEETRHARMAASDFRPDLYGSVAKKSETYGVVILPPDFLLNPVRSASSRPPESPADYFRIIGAGIGGTAMPTWIDSVSDAFNEKDIWAIAYYVQDLVAIKDTPAADALRKTLAEQPAFEIPAAPVPASAPAPAPGEPGTGAPGSAAPAPASGAPGPESAAPATAAPLPPKHPAPGTAAGAAAPLPAKGPGPGTAAP